MPYYILTLILTPEGRENLLTDSESLHRIASEVETEDTQVLGMYAVLGEYDFVAIVESPDNEDAARFSLELGVEVGAHIRTMPAIPIGRLGPSAQEGSPSDLESDVAPSHGNGPRHGNSP